MNRRVTRLGRLGSRLSELGVLTAIAVLAGWTVTNLAEAALVSDGRSSPPRTRAKGAAEPTPPAGLVASASDVKGRNLFCSGCTRGPDPPPPPPVGRPSLGDAVLVATQLTAGDPQWTLASVRFPSAGQLRLLGPGSRVSGARITRVSATSVEFVQGGRRGVLALLPGQGAGGPTAANVPRPSRGCPAGLRRTGERRYELPRSLLRQLVSGLAGGARDVAVAPLVRRGRLAGLRLTRVRTGSAVHCLGLRRGDEVTAVNGLRLESPDVILTLLAQVQAARHVTVTLQRRGRLLTLDYDVQ